MCDFSKYGIPSEEWLRVEATLPPPGRGQSLEALKEATNLGREAVARAQMETFSEKVTTHDWTIPTRDAYELEARSYRPASAPLDEKLPIYIHLHGGGFLFGTLSSEDAICSRIAINTGVLVVNINYRHTPEYTYPTAWNDVEDALLWMCANSARLCGDVERLVVGGISAGACLAAALTRTLLGSGLNPSPAPKILGQVLMIPSLISSASYESQMRQMKDPSVSSYHQAANAPILNTERRKLFNDLLKVEITDPQDKRNSPGHLTTEEARKMPTTTLGIAGYDPLRDEGILYGKLLAENGVPTSVNVFSGVPHGFRRFGEKLSVCEIWDKVMEDGITWALSKPSAAGEFVIKSY